MAGTLVKRADGSRQAPVLVGWLLNSGVEAVRHATKLLGRVTHAANNHRMQVLNDSGNLFDKVYLDSTDDPRQARSRVDAVAQKDCRVRCYAVLLMPFFVKWLRIFCNIGNPVTNAPPISSMSPHGSINPKVVGSSRMKL